MRNSAGSCDMNTQVIFIKVNGPVLGIKLGIQNVI